MKSNKIKLQFIITKCEQIAQHPSQINSINSVIQTYLDMNISVSDSLMYEKKLDSFLSMCRLVQKFIKKSIETKNQTMINFLGQKIKILVEILISTEISNAMQAQEEFQMVAQNLYQIVVSLNQASSSTLTENIVNKIILHSSQNSLKLNLKLLACFYQNFTNGSLVSHILLTLNKKLQQFNGNAEKRTLDSLSTFFINLPSFDLIQLDSAQPNSKERQKIKSNELQISFEDEKEELKPKKQFKKLFQSTFLKILPLIQTHKDVALGLYRKLDSRIMSKMSNPLILSDYFLNKFKQDPQIQIEVLSCLFILVGKYGLEFENFYPQLQVLIQQKKDGKSVYQMKNSKRFFKLVETALRSSKVPFKTIEIITKAILNQIILQQSQFAFWGLSFFFNLTKKHRKLLEFVKDIPQLQIMSKHYNPKIRSLVNQLNKDLNKAQYLDIQKFSKIDCRKVTLSKIQQLGKKLRGSEEAEFKIPGLFEEI